MNPIEFYSLLGAAAVAIVLLILILVRPRGAAGDGATTLALVQQHQQQSLERIDRVEREVRLQLQASAQATRQDLAAGLAQFQAAVKTPVLIVSDVGKRVLVSNRPLPAPLPSTSP